MVRPSYDQVHVTVEMGKDDMDSFVFCLATKKAAVRLAKDMADLVSNRHKEGVNVSTLSCHTEAIVKRNVNIAA